MSTPYYSDDHVTLYHGDCREVTEWLEADVLVTDPPYGIAWNNVTLTNGTLRGYKRSAKLRHEGIVGDEDTSMRDRALEMWDHGPAVVFGSPRITPPFGTKQALTWRKPLDAGVIGSALPWRRDTEAIYVLGSWPKSTGTSSSVIDGPRGMRSYVDGTHPHVKPLAVLEQLIAATPPGIIADPFAGSGTTLVAAKQLGRKAIGVEIEEKYCEIAAKRCAQEVLDFGTAS